MNSEAIHVRGRARVHPVLSSGLPLAKCLLLGLLATWLTSVMLQPQPARAEELPSLTPVQLALTASPLDSSDDEAVAHCRMEAIRLLVPTLGPAVAVNIPARGWFGSGPIEHSLATLLRNTPPVRAPEQIGSPAGVAGNGDAGRVADLEPSVACERAPSELRHTATN